MEDFSGVDDTAKDLLAWVACRLKGMDRDVVVKVQNLLSKSSKMLLLEYSRDDLLFLLQEEMETATARQITIILYSGMHGGSRQPSEAPELLIGQAFISFSGHLDHLLLFWWFVASEVLSDRFTKATDALLMMLKNMIQVKPIEESSAHQYDVAAWFRGVQSYCCGPALKPRCSVLGFLFKSDDYDSSIRLVAEHLIPRRQGASASMIDVDVNNPRNGLILCKHLESLLQTGRWSLVPVSCDDSDLLWCRIHVADAELQTMLYDIGAVASDRKPLVVHSSSGECEGLKMQHLHGQLIAIQKPYIRSLFLKNLMACTQNPELPNPLHRLKDYISMCSSLERFSMGMVLSAGEPEQREETQPEAQPEVFFQLHPPSWIGGKLRVAKGESSSSSNRGQGRATLLPEKASRRRSRSRARSRRKSVSSRRDSRQRRCPQSSGVDNTRDHEKSVACFLNQFGHPEAAWQV